MSDGTTTTTTSCPECGSDWGGSSWCPSCGFYPAINSAPTGFFGDQNAAEDEVIYEHWWEVVPGWLWSLVAGVCMIIVISGCVRVMFAESPIRLWWTAGQMLAGVVGVGSAHFMAYLYSVSRSDKLGPLDMFMQPIGTWLPVLRNLPESSNLVCWFAFSITALASGYLVVDGLNYSEWVKREAIARQRERMEQQALEEEEGPKRRRTAMSLIVSTAVSIAQAQQASCGGVPVPDTLEDAMFAFTGQIEESGILDSAREAGGSLEHTRGGGPGSGGGFSFVGTGQEDVPESILRDSLPRTQSERRGPSSSSPATRTNGSGGRTSSTPSYSSTAKELTEVECLVLGYTTNSTGEIRSVLLAAAPDFRFLRFVAKVPVEQIAPDVLRRLLREFEQIPARKPMVRCPYGGRWVLPELFCVTTYDGWGADGRLNKPEVVRMMNTQSN